MKFSYPLVCLILFSCVWFLSSCSGSVVSDSVPPSFLHYEGSKVFVDTDEVNLLVDESGKPVSTKILIDDSLGTVRTFDLLPIVVSAPVRDDGDGLWRLQVWISSGRSIADSGFTVPIVLGYDDTVIEYDFLPGYIFAYKSGNTETIATLAADLKPGDQIYVHVIGEHSFTDEDLVALDEIGFDYAQLVEGHEAENIALLEALAHGDPPTGDEIRGVGAIFRGIPEQ